jgi:hypothetical protein
MTDYLVDTGTARFWEPVVAEWTWISIVFNNYFVNHSVNFFSGDSYFTSLMSCIKSFTSDLAGKTDTFDFFLSVNWNVLAVRMLDLRKRLTGCGILWLLNVLRNFTFWCNLVSP